jgi:NodT family efflux transporter outer membrane factor (OMF) lipoprotein
VRLLRLPLATLALGALATACAVGPNYRPPPPPHTERYVPGSAPVSSDAQRFLDGQPVPARWWTGFGSDALNALVERAFAANPSIASAEAALKVGRENYLAERGSYFPTATGSASAIRNRDAVQVLSPTLSSGAAVYNLYTAQVGVSYALDVFGGVRRAVEASEAQAEVAREQRDATYLTVAGNVVVAAVQLAGLAEEVAATEQAVGFARDSLAILNRQFELGAVGRLDVAAQEAALAQLEATLPPLVRQREAARHLLAVLTGALPGDAGDPGITLAALKLPPEVPLGVPAELVTRRPDVRAAAANLHAASAADGVAIANLLPQIAISGTIGSSSTAIGDLLKSGSGFWSVGASLTQTLFAGGALVHRKRAADAALDQAAADYRGTVLGAYQNVADALRALEADGATLNPARRAEQSAAESLAIVRRQLELGGTGYLALLAAEQALEQARLTRIAAEGAQLADTAALFQALAGPATPR